MKIFDGTLAQLERSLDVRLSRHNLLAGNLANVDTPGYRPQDIDFAAAMDSVRAAGGDLGTAASGSLGLRLTNDGHLGLDGQVGVGADGQVPVVEVEGEAPTLDGNRVDLDRTMATLAENGMLYNASARIASKKLAILRYVASEGGG